MLSSLVKKVRSFLYDPRIKNLDVDDPALLDLHNSIINKKIILKSTFNTFYDEMLRCNTRFISGRGIEIELGSGAGFLKKRKPSVVTTDIRDSIYIERKLDAQKMNLNSHSVRCIYAINVFHHLPNPDLFFKELNRVLVAGGGVILIEPHNGFMSAIIHKYLHKDEQFNIYQKDWSNKRIRGPLSGANQALSYIVFKRDKKKFVEKYGKFLEIKHQAYINNGIRYLISGGLNFRQLAPSIFLPLIQLIEWLLSPFARYTSLHQVTVIIKKN
jgi:SAM-dependent methyltransferase